jgi:hypothetical protein
MADYRLMTWFSLDIQLAKSGARTESNANKQGTSAFFFLSKRRDMSKCGNDLGQFFSNALSHLSQKTKAPREHLKNSTSDGIFTMDFLWIFHTPFGEDSLRRP